MRKGISLGAKSHNYLVDFLNPDLHMCHFGDLRQHLPECWTGCTPRHRKKVYPTERVQVTCLLLCLFAKGIRALRWYQLVSMVFGRTGHVGAPKFSAGSQTATPPRFCCADSVHRWEPAHPALLSVLLLPMGGKGDKPGGAQGLFSARRGNFPWSQMVAVLQKSRSASKASLRSSADSCWELHLVLRCVREHLSPPLPAPPASDSLLGFYK